MADLTNIKQVQKQLQQKLAKYLTEGVSGVVGYKAAYALYVHENLEMKLKGLPRPGKRGMYWDPQGRAKSKFLEDPARTLSGDGTLGNIIGTALRAGKTLGQAILLACLRLMRESQLQVPVDTGNLKNSAFVRLESDEGEETIGGEE